MSTRLTEYEKIPKQTHSMGMQELKLPIDVLFDQSAILTTAAGVGELIGGESLGSETLQQLRRKCELADRDVAGFQQRGSVLPRLSPFEPSEPAAMAAVVLDFAADDGNWRQHFDATAPALVDRKVTDLRSRLDVFQDSLIRKHGFQPALEALSQLQRGWLTDLENRQELWEPSYTDRLKRSGAFYERFAEELENVPWWKFWQRKLSKADVDQLKQQYDKDTRLMKVRIQELETELVFDVKRRLTSASVPGSLVERIQRLSRQCEGLSSLQLRLEKSVEMIDDTVTTVHVVRSTKDPVGDNVVFHDLVSGAFQASGLGPSSVAGHLRAGLRVDGLSIGPAQLADMEGKQAESLLRQFSTTYFEPAVDGVLRLDLATPEIRLPLAKALQLACNKAKPYLLFPDVEGAEPTREFYLHCHHDLRPILEKLRPGGMRISNPIKDKDFHLPQRHVLTLTSNVLGAGHTRRQFAEGCYLREKMLGKEVFESIYPFDQRMARPSYIASRPTSERDATQVFDLAVEFGLLAQKDLGNSKTVFTVVPMDDTIRPCFEQRIVRRLKADADHFVRLLDEEWFVELCETAVAGLKADWHKPLLEMMDRASAASIARRLARRGILEHNAASGQYRFGTSYQPFMPRRPELFETETRLRAGFSRSHFIRKMLSCDELYTRMIEDLIAAEARGQLPFRRLTKFAQSLVNQRRPGGSL